MKKILTTALFTTLLMIQTAAARTIEVDVHGMTCPFCVDSLERKFKAIPAISNIQVSLKMKKIRLETAEDQPSIEDIQEIILEAGFTPTNVKIISEMDK